jgi:hypothetical protein
MRRTFTIIAGTLAIALLSTAAVLAGGGVSGTAKGHGQAVSEVAKAVDYVSGRARGEAVSALAKTHGAAVSAAARAQGQANAAAGKDKGSDAAAAKGSNADEPGGLKDSAGD